MWERKDYTFEGEHFTVDNPHNILPKPYGNGHPPIWVACGNPPTFGKAGELGIGAIAFNFEPIYDLQARDRGLQGRHRRLHRARRPVQERQRDDDQRRHLPGGPRPGPRDHDPRGRGYLYTMVNLYHDTMPVPRAPSSGPSPRRELDRGDRRPGHRVRRHPLRHARRGLRAAGPVPGRRRRPAGLRAAERPGPRRGARVPRAVRRQGHPRLRPGPGPPHHPDAPDRAAQVRPVRERAPRHRDHLHPGLRPGPGRNGASPPGALRPGPAARS